MTGWSSPVCTGGSTTDITLTVNPAITSNGTFQVCLTNSSGSVTDLCGNIAAPGCLSFNVGAVTPAFNIPGTICTGAVAPVLPAVSDNGIPGTWSPATVSTTTTATYTFTPVTGQCAIPISVPITVTAGILPIFNNPPPICSGSAVPVLPATSNNGITGTWSPASVSNSISATYTFTPNVGQCALTATLLVTVTSTVSSSTPINICNNQLPYSWNGNSYAAAGTYSVTLTGVGGCDSVATLILSVNSAAASNTPVTICNNQLPYLWNGNNYAAAGTYVVPLTASGGCDSLATLMLTVTNGSASSTAITVCNNQLPYSWNGNSYPSAGTYAVTLTGSDGCDSIATLVLASNAVITSSTSVTICDNQLPYLWNGNSYPNAGTYSVTLTATAGCDSIATLILTLSNPPTSTSPVTICESQLPYSWNGNSYTAAGSYSVTLTGSGGCDSIAVLALTAVPVATSTTSISVCDVQLPYAWNGNSYPLAGTYTVNLTGSTGCDSIATLILTANSTVSSTTSVTICSNLLPYSWNGNSYSSAGTYVTTLTSSGGCDSIATLNLSLNNSGTSSTFVTLCTNQFPYIWNGNSYASAGNYTVTLTGSSGCDSIARLFLAASGAVISLSRVTICHDQVPYTWNGNNYSITGTYTVSLLTNTGCDSIASLDLTVLPASTAQAGIDDIAVYNMPYQLSGSGGGSYQWSPGHLLNNANLPNPVAVLTNDQTFILTVTDAAGCRASDTINLRVLRGPTFYIPTAFTPNGDGLNDIFRPTYAGIASLDFFRVFNRYGELVFETADTGHGWDGTYKGKPQEYGTYVWTIKGTDRKTNIKSMKGNVVLIR